LRRVLAFARNLGGVGIFTPAPGTAKLITTRRDDVLPIGATKVIVDAMAQREAVELLARNLGNVGAADKIALTKLRPSASANGQFCSAL
jgi:hypothetical protein